MSADALNDREVAVLAKLANNLEAFSATNLTIIDKEGNEQKLIFNKAQRHIHRCLQAQLVLTGMVRAVIIKGRQQGSSTYVGARFYHHAVFKKNKRVYILSHEASSTEELFDRVETYHKNTSPTIRPDTEEDNSRILKFTNGSRYRVGTAGAKNTGRSQTAQYLHASEGAYYENIENIQTGVMEIVADMQGTEIIIESTANGMNWYHGFTMDALAGEEMVAPNGTKITIGKNGYQVIFVPWFWQDEYRADVPANFEPTEEEDKLIQMYKLDHAQIMWRRRKIAKFKSTRKFKQEYPCTVQEAFQSSGNSFYDSDLVALARKCNVKADERVPLVLGVDPAHDKEGGDRTVLTLRRGREVIRFWKYDLMKAPRLAGIIMGLVDKFDIDKVFIDYALGYAVADIIEITPGYENIIQTVHFNESPFDDIYMNKRAEMAFAFRDWLEAGLTNLPDDDDMAVDIASLPDFEQTSNGKIKFPDKKEIRKKTGRSPDILDSIMLTFAYPVRSKVVNKDEWVSDRERKQQARRSKVSTINMARDEDLA